MGPASTNAENSTRAEQVDAFASLGDGYERVGGGVISTAVTPVDRGDPDLMSSVASPKQVIASEQNPDGTFTTRRWVVEAYAVDDEGGVVDPTAQPDEVWDMKVHTVVETYTGLEDPDDWDPDDDADDYEPTAPMSMRYWYPSGDLENMTKTAQVWIDRDSAANLDLIRGEAHSGRLFGQK